MTPGPNTPKRLASSAPGPNDAGTNTLLTNFRPLSMRSKALFKRPLQDDLPFPPMDPPPPQASSFLNRVYDITQRWIQEEWSCIEAIKRAAKPDTPPAHIAEAIREAQLTPATLAKQLDNISMSALKRELARFGAPPPGQLIRSTRIQFAKHLLTHTRLKIHHIAARVGYANAQRFATMFFRETGYTPRDFRKVALQAQVPAPGSIPKPNPGKPCQPAQKP